MRGVAAKMHRHHGEFSPAFQARETGQSVALEHRPLPLGALAWAAQREGARQQEVATATRLPVTSAARDESPPLPESSRQRAPGPAVGFLAWLVLLVLLIEWRTDWFNGELPRLVAVHLAWCLRVLGLAGQADGLVVSSSLCRIEIIGECTALYPAVVFVAAVLASPVARKAKLGGVLLGLPAIGLMNTVRLLSLCYICRYHPAFFAMAHEVVWQSLLVFLTALLWLVWVNLSRPEVAGDAS